MQSPRLTLPLHMLHAERVLRGHHYASAEHTQHLSQELPWARTKKRLHGIFQQAAARVQSMCFESSLRMSRDAGERWPDRGRLLSKGMWFARAGGSEGLLLPRMSGLFVRVETALPRVRNLRRSERRRERQEPFFRFSPKNRGDLFPNSSPQSWAVREASTFPKLGLPSSQAKSGQLFNDLLRPTAKTLLRAP